ncbi:MAG: tRNA pseudouridine(55) synthase TruB [Acidimicrobiales bacterium]|nr:tRNA pseudouridine(55) synthase TruB [Acidimicrobiales bacterium]
MSGGGAKAVVDGLAVVDKAAGWTSHDVVAKARGIVGQKKVGHSGTLDPDATGVLLLGFGKVTRLLTYLTALSKSYVGEVVLGTETDTLDAAGQVTATHDMRAVTLEQARLAAEAFVGDIEQIPPMVSAVKIGGKRLHELARAGETVERPPRPVTVHRLHLDEARPATADEAMVLRIEVDCSSGTYIRTIADDLGHALGGGAHLRNLRRTAIGSFGLDEARPLEQLEILAPAVAMRDYPSLTVDDAVAMRIANGAVLSRVELGVTAAEGDGPWAVLSEAGDLVAVYEGRDAERVKPAVVLA